MKKQIKIAQTLSFDKETVAKLDENQLGGVAGGGSFSCNKGVAAAALEDAQDNEATWSLICGGINSCCNDSCNG
jgi:hypothetical protein